MGRLITPMKQDIKKILKAKTADELSAMVRSANEKISQMKFDLRAGKTANIKDLRAAKKERAVALTLINQKKHE